MSLPAAVLQQVKEAVTNASSQLPNLQAEVARLQKSGQDATALNTRIVAIQQNIQKLKLTYPEAFQ